MNKIKGDLIKLAKEGYFDVIIHGCNCFSTQKSGLAKQMVEAFKTDIFYKEKLEYNINENIDKLGTIDYKSFLRGKNQNYNVPVYSKVTDKRDDEFIITIVNCYTQYYYGTLKLNEQNKKFWKPLDYDALRLCMRKINHIFANKHIGVPMIGSDLANGDWEKIEKIIEEELFNCKITIVEYDK